MPDHFCHNYLLNTVPTCLTEKLQDYFEDSNIAGITVGRLHTHSQYQLLFDKVFLKLVCFPTPPI